MRSILLGFLSGPDDIVCPSSLDALCVEPESGVDVTTCTRMPVGTCKCKCTHHCHASGPGNLKETGGSGFYSFLNSESELCSWQLVLGAGSERLIIMIAGPGGSYFLLGFTFTCRIDVWYPVCPESGVELTLGCQPEHGLSSSRSTRAGMTGRLGPHSNWSLHPL